MSGEGHAEIAFDVRLRIAGETYLLPVGDVREVVRRGTVTWLPQAPTCVLGVCNLRGEVLPVIDAASLLGAGATAAAQSIVVVEQAGRRAGFAVDAVEGVQPLTDATQPSESPLLSGTSLLDGRLTGHVDAGRLLDAVTAAGR